MTWGKIFIATRLEKMVSSRFLQVWSELITKGIRAGDNVASVRGMVAHRASNEAVRMLLKSDCDTLFLLDSDADVETDFLERFREYAPGFDYDILQAFYTRRGWPPRPIWIQENALGQTMETYISDPDTVQDVAIAGTHAVLIRRKVFEDMLGDGDPETFEWFWYNRHSDDSEDGVFSKEAARQGFRLGATTHVKAGHISEITTNWETYNQYIDLTGRRPLLKRYGELAEIVGQFTGEPADVVIAKAINASENVLEPWHKAKLNGAESVRGFYGQPDNGYLYELTNWNCQPGYERLIKPLKDIKGKNVLIIGAGLGTEYAYLKDKNNVDVFELPGVLREFLRFRFGDDINLLEYDTLFGVQGSYDVIVALDVIEHIHPQEIEDTLRHIRYLMRNGGQLYYHNNFGQQDIYPMHYDHSEIFNQWLEVKPYENQMLETV